MLHGLTITDVLIIIVFVIWAAFSLLCQGTSRLKTRLKSFDIFNILPNYKFFCPNPVRYDYHLYYRSRQKDNSISDWQEIPVGRRTSLLCSVWNPLKRERKVFHKVIKTLKGFKQQSSGNPRSLVYQLLLSYIKKQAGQPGCISTQFRITYKQDLDLQSVEKVFYTSVFHEHRPV